LDFAPILRLALLAGGLALLLLGWLWWRQRHARAGDRLAALTALLLFLTFDLIVFGSFTRLSDSGLGCPDWPGCYGHASPIGAATDIHAAQTAQPTGPVTFSKAWIEMIHRYLAMTVGALILVMTLASWAARRTLPLSPWWATATLVWVLVQGLFGALTVTWKLKPLIVTLHLLGGMSTLALLLTLLLSGRQAPDADAADSWLRPLAAGALILVIGQIALGGWVSSNYAALACSDFPLCQGQWKPAMDLAQAFTLQRELGYTADGSLLSTAALTAIHWSHRLGALAVLAGSGALAVALLRSAWQSGRRWGGILLGLLGLQIGLGIANILLSLPLGLAVAHNLGAAALLSAVLAINIRLHQAKSPWRNRKQAL
jgi:heme a synthase